MRLALLASALIFGSFVFAVHAAIPQASAPATSTPASTTPASKAPAPAATAPTAAQVANEAAARHVKRTVCLKEARTRKLIGAQKTAFLKNCLDAAPQAVSANRISPPDRP